LQKEGSRGEIELAGVERVQEISLQKEREKKVKEMKKGPGCFLVE